MQHYHFIKSTCHIGDPPFEGPQGSPIMAITLKVNKGKMILWVSNALSFRLPCALVIGQGAGVLGSGGGGLGLREGVEDLGVPGGLGPHR